MNQVTRIWRHGFRDLWLLLVFVGLASFVVYVSRVIAFGGDRFTIFALSILLVAATTIVLPIRIQLLLFWIWLPFIDFLKRLTFLDSEPRSAQYLMLIGPDILLVMIVLKLLLLVLHSPVRRRWSHIDLVLSLFAAYSLLSALTSPGASLSARVASAGMRVWPMAVYYVAAIYMNRPAWVSRFLKVTFVLTLVVALYGIRQFFFGLLPFEEAWLVQSTGSRNAAHLKYDLEQGVFRTFGTMDSHSSYGLFVGMGLVYAWVYRRRLGFILWFLVSLILTLGLLVSFTRFTWLMPPLAFGFIFLFSYRRITPLFSLMHLRRAALLLTGIVGSFLVFYLIMGGLYGQRLVRTSNPYLQRALGTGTLEARLQFTEALTSGYSFSLFGRGLASSGYFASKFGFKSEDINFHNIFIDIADSLGLIGLALFLIFLYLFIRRVILVVESEGDRYIRRILIANLALVLSMITVGHFNGITFYSGHVIPFFFWALCGILAHFSRDNTTKTLSNAYEN